MCPGRGLIRSRKMSHHGVDGPIIVGRTDALEVLQRRLEAALQGQGSLTLIRGEPGIGKTSLALACGKNTMAHGAVFAVGRCYEHGIMPAFGPWHEILTDLHPTTLNLAPLPHPFGKGQPV